MKLFFSALLFFFPVSLLFSQDTINYRIVLIGDAGQLTNGRHPVAAAVRKTIPMDARTTIVYLGDNLYRTGLPDAEYAGYERQRAVLDSQLSITEGTKAKIYMIPGNHDWLDGGRYGYDAVIREQLYVDLLNEKNVYYEPKDGCPGPVEVSLGPDVSLIMFDSQWWLHPYDKPGIESDCNFKTQDEVLAELTNMLTKNSKKLIILAGHHTFKSISPHGGYYTWKQHIFPFTDINPNLYIPLPIIGSIYPITRGMFGTPQDLKHPNYQNMINSIQNVAKPYHQNIIFAAGHDHSLQYVKDSSFNYIVSGSGSKTNRVSNSKKAQFKSAVTGFSVLEVSKNRNVRLVFYEVTDSVRIAYSNVIMNFSPKEQPAVDSLNRVVENPELIKYQDTITISASEKYITHSATKKLMMGTNYRKEWETPVNMKVFNIKTEKGGFKPVGVGGGMQTKSLQLTDSKDRKWVLRTVDKDPEKNIPENFKQTLAGDMVKDFISASHPYASLTVPVLADALDLTVPRPELFFIPDDPNLKDYRKDFKNTVVFLEERDPSRHGEKVSNTTEVFNDLITESDHRVDQPSVLKARLLDILIADWDRHFDQWKWAKGDTGKGKVYYPIPKDRDVAMFYSDGLIMKVISMKVMPFLKGFRKDIPSVNWLGETAKDFDRVFMNDLDAKEWSATIKEVQEKITDSVIHASIKKLPPEIYKMDSAVLTEKLLGRRGLLEKAGMTYYRFLSKNVNVIGTNDKEYFKVTSIGDSLNIKVYHRRKSDNDTNFLLYNRNFIRKETKEIRLYGLNSDDQFDIDENVKSRIRIRVIGGKGNDTFNIRGHIRNYLYDIDSGNYIKQRSHSVKLFSKAPSANYYNFIGFKYNKTSYPGLTFAFSNDDGFLAGVGFSRKIYGFRNEPYARFQKFVVLNALTRGGFQARYSGEFNHAIRGTDIVVNSTAMYPGISNFFGMGNDTRKDPDKSILYYRARFSHIETQLLFQKRLFEKLRVMAGPVHYRYWNAMKDNKNTVLGKEPWGGFDSSRIYTNKSYAGGMVAINVNNLNNELFPTRGIQWNTEFVSMGGITKSSHSLTKLYSDMEVYASLNEAKLIAVLQLGAGKIFSKDPEYFQALTLGARNFLRGFRKDRFAGTSVLYSSVELRYKLFDIKSYLLPGSFGLVGFTETGRVWLKGKTSHTWHYTYGGGFYFIPFNLFILSATIGYSKEESIFNFSIGTRINLTF